VKAAAVAAALTAAALLPGEPLGVAVPLVALLVAIAAAATAPRATLDGVLFGALALGLTAVAALRDAGWVVALDLVAAWLLASAAVAGPRLAALVAPYVRLRWAAEIVPRAPSGIAPALRGAAVGCLLVLPFGALFWTADPAFAELGRAVPLPSADGLAGRIVAFVLVFLAAAGLPLAARRPLALAVPRPALRLVPWEWGPALGLLIALFLTFVVVQATVLFGGHDHVLRTAGLTYAEYARQGFSELIAAAVLTLAVVGTAVVVADAPRRSHRLLLRALLAVLCALTIVVLVSALRRLLLYEDAFGLTRLRLFVEAFCLWLGGVFALVGLAGVAAPVWRRFARIAAAATAASLLAFSLANPDAMIAERNVNRFEATGRVDLTYLRGLSADAVPALTELPPKLRRHVLAAHARRLARPEQWSSFNVARELARRTLASAPSSYPSPREPVRERGLSPERQPDDRPVVGVDRARLAGRLLMRERAVEQDPLARLPLRLAALGEVATPGSIGSHDPEPVPVGPVVGGVDECACVG
jgi:hypothetical protein